MLESQLTERTIPGLHSVLVQQLPQLSLDTPILDLGCGTGAWLERLATHGFSNLHGVDTDIKQLRTNKATIYQANLDRDELAFSHKFELITAIEVIEHLESPYRIFYHAQKNLTENGYLLLTTPNIHSISCRLRFLATGKLASFDEKGDPTHIYPVLLTSLHRVLPRYSLKILKQWGYPDKGSLIYRQSTRLISNFLKLLLPNDNPGDTLCLLIQRTR